jgi:hypothetical protein
MASSEPSRKRGREEVSPSPPTEPEEVPPPPPTELEEVPPPPPEEVPPTPPEDVKRLKPPLCKVARQPVVPLCAPEVNFQDACFSVKMLYQAWQSLGMVVVHLGVQRPTDSLQMTMMDYAFKVNVLAGQLEREVVPRLRRRRRWRPRRLQLRLRLRRWGSFGGDYLWSIILFLC